MALHFLIFATYAILAGWAALGLPMMFQSTGTLVAVLAGASVFLMAAMGHILYIFRLERQEREYELDTVREALTDVLHQLEAMRKQYADLRVLIADAKYQNTHPDPGAAELLESEILQNVLQKLESLANGDQSGSPGQADMVDGPKADTVKIRR